ncbi:hypothetical protein [Pedobacter sp. ASV28]|uniref:hypothetical protein n=1 Tax=Pedobacter sp. ASV28 TaxID=2795123 RepID=UPI0018ED8811|nr:hypothetical protein [Pedobacter sp. ASV28]
MEQKHDLQTFAKILTEKGYDGYFTTQAAYPDKIRESLGRYMESSGKGLEPQSNRFILRGYLQWSGEDKPRVECSIWVRHEKGKLDLLKMEITKTDRYGQPVGRATLTGLSATELPKATEAVAMVADTAKRQATPVKNRFKL